MRIAVAAASPAIASVVKRVISGVPGWSVAWTATTVEQVVSRCLADPPRVLLLSLSLPGGDIVEATRRAAAAARCAIVLMVGGAGDDVGTVFQAFGAGAIDSVGSPRVGRDGRLEGGEELVRKVRAAAKASGGRAFAEPWGVEGGQKDAIPRLVAVGASTGGPAALATVLGALPRQCPAAVVVIQHMGARFTSNLASWLGHTVALPVRVARDGDSPAQGVVAIAGREDDLVLRPDLAFGYRPPAPDAFFHPSVDVFFGSLVEHWPATGVAVLLTGMGSDGAEGLLALRRRGWRTIAQDERTSAVYGMPKAAAMLDAAGEVLPVGKIGPAILRAVEAAEERGARE